MNYSALCSNIYQMLFVDPYDGNFVQLQSGSAFQLQIDLNAEFVPSAYYGVCQITVIHLFLL
jgi:hypothetical protein